MLLGLGVAGSFYFGKNRIAKVEQVSRHLKRKLERNQLEYNGNMERMTKALDDGRTAAKATGAADVAKSVLGVADDLERTLNAAREIEGNVRGGDDDDARTEALVEGLHMVQSNMLRALESQGIVRIDPLNETFDPHIHEAVDTVRTGSIATQAVYEVSQVGYSLGNRVLRPARVVVNLGPEPVPKPADSASVS